MANHDVKSLSFVQGSNTYTIKPAIHYAVCGTGATTQNKSVTIPGITALEAGLSVRIKFTNAQNYNGVPKLKINNLSAISITRSGTVNAGYGEWEAGQVLDFVYDGTSFIRSSSKGQEYSEATTSAAGLMSASDKTKTDGMAMVSYGTCTTAADAAEKVVTISNTNWQLKVGSIIAVKYTNTNTYSATADAPVTLNVNGTGAKNIYYNTTATPTGTGTGVFGYANRHIYYIYDGTYWVWLNQGWLDGNDNTVPSAQCTTSASTAAKTATLTQYTMTANTWVHVNMRYANSYNGAITLNINSRGAKPIYINGAASSSSNKTLPAGTYLVFYDGTAFQFRTDGKLPGSIIGDAATVNGKTVGTNVPANAVFTDTNTWRPVSDSVSSTSSSDAASSKAVKTAYDKANTLFVGATSGADGAAGIVPKPYSADRSKFLCGDGTWAMATGKMFVVNVGSITNASGSYNGTITNSDTADITADMKCILMEVDDDTVFRAPVTITPGEGSITISCDEMVGTVEVTLSFMFVTDSNPFTSSEFDILSNRIGSINALTTTDKSNVVNAVNEVNDHLANLFSTSIFNTYTQARNGSTTIWTAPKDCIAFATVTIQLVPANGIGYFDLIKNAGVQLCHIESGIMPGGASGNAITLSAICRMKQGDYFKVATAFDNNSYIGGSWFNVAY